MSDKILKVLEDNRQKMVALQDEHSKWVKTHLEPIKITNDQDLAKVADLCHYAKKSLIILDDSKKTINEPFTTIIKNTNNWFKTNFVDDLTTIKTWSELEISLYRETQRIEKEEILKKETLEIDRLASISLQKQIDKGVSKEQATTNVQLVTEHIKASLAFTHESLSDQKKISVTMGKLVSSEKFSFDLENSSLKDLILFVAQNIDIVDYTNLLDFNIININKFKPTKTFVAPLLGGIVWKKTYINTAR